jgi:Major Facilitator Superfamily
MPESKDPGKDGLSSSAASTMLSSGLEKELGTPKHSPSLRSSSHVPSRGSVTSIESDPLAPLQETLASPGEHMGRPCLTPTATSIGTTGSRLPDFEVDFEPDDAENPRNWPLWYKGLAISALSFATWTIIFYSTSYTSGMPGMMEEFGISSEPLTTLGVTAYLFGLAVGSLLMAPISEIYGRRPVYVVALLLFSVLVIPCALATSLPEVIVVRFFG